MNTRLVNLSDTERLLRPPALAMLSVLVLHMMSVSELCIEWTIEIDMSAVSAVFSVSAGIMLIVVAGTCIRLLRLSGESTVHLPHTRTCRRYEWRNVLLAVAAAVSCLLAASVIFASVPYRGIGPTSYGAFIATQLGLVWLSLFLSVKSVQVGAASIAATAALNDLRSRSS